METTELLRLKKAVETAESNITKAEGQIEYMMTQLKERGFRTISDAQMGVQAIEKKLKKYESLYKKSTDKIEKIMEEINV